MKTLSFDMSSRVALQLQESACNPDLFRRRQESVLHWRLRVDRLKTCHLLQISKLSHALLSNLSLSEAVDRNENFAVNAFLNSPDAEALKAVLTEKSSKDCSGENDRASGTESRMKTEYLFVQLHAANDQIMNAKTELERIWQVRHEGLKEQLSEIRRTYVNWSLKVANMLFVNGLPEKIVKDRFEDTPLNEFKASLLYNRFESVPDLAKAVDLAGVQDRKLFDAADELNRLVMFSEWDKAYLLYRDIFPPSTNALVARLDQVISFEKSIIEAQAKGIRLFSEKIAPASEIMMDSLDLLTRMLLEKREKMVLTSGLEIIPLPGKLSA